MIDIEHWIDVHETELHELVQRADMHDDIVHFLATLVHVRAGSWRALAEEGPSSCKDVDLVVATCEHAGLARRVARLRRIGVVKG